MEEYIQALRKQLKGFSPDEQEALMEEIQSHIEAGEEDPKMGTDVDQRRKKLLEELGSPNDIRTGFKDLYRPDRLIDYLLIVVPYLFYPYLNAFYTSLMPKFGWADIRLDILVHLPLVAIALWRRSAALALFWITILVSQLLYVNTQLYSYYGIQTLLWALLLSALIFLAGRILWTNRQDLLIVVFGLLPLSMCIIGSIISGLHPTVSVPYGIFDRSLLAMHLYIRDFRSYSIFVTMALFFLPTRREIRWLALMLSGLMIGLSRDYLIEYQTGSMGLLASWVYYLWLSLPLFIVFIGWWSERSKRKQLELAET